MPDSARLGCAIGALGAGTGRVFTTGVLLRGGVGGFLLYLPMILHPRHFAPTHTEGFIAADLQIGLLIEHIGDGF